LSCPQETATARPIRFVKYFDKASTALGADQMAEALAARGLDARSIPASEVARERGSRLVFVKTSRLDHLIAARLRGCRALLDVQDTPVFKRRLKNAALYEGAIFKNRRQKTDFDRRGWRSRVIHHQWDPRYRPHRVPDGEVRVAYLGDPRSLSCFGRLPGVTFVETDLFERAPEFNVHLSVREPGREFLYKPGAKVSTAAACRAVLVTTRDESALELLGGEYPFYCEPGAAAVAAALERVRAAAGGPEWRRALAALDRVREATLIDRIAGRYLDYFAELDA
jgi:hypothetical protein